VSRDLLAVLRLRNNAYGDAGRLDSPGATTVGGECDPLPSAARGACASCPPVFPGAAGAAPTASPAYFPLPLPSPLPPPVSSPLFPFDGVGAARHLDLVVGVKARRRTDLQSAVGGGLSEAESEMVVVQVLVIRVETVGGTSRVPPSVNRTCL